MDAPVQFGMRAPLDAYKADMRARLNKLLTTRVEGDQINVAQTSVCDCLPESPNLKIESQTEVCATVNQNVFISSRQPRYQPDADRA